MKTKLTKQQLTTLCIIADAGSMPCPDLKERLDKEGIQINRNNLISVLGTLNKLGFTFRSKRMWVKSRMTSTHAITVEGHQFAKNITDQIAAGADPTSFYISPVEYEALQEKRGNRKCISSTGSHAHYLPSLSFIPAVAA